MTTLHELCYRLGSLLFWQHPYTGRVNPIGFLRHVGFRLMCIGDPSLEG